ncbi:MAG: hypothetical protein ACFFAX_15315, partial [Promethearchaeota archaeon]
MSKCYAFLLKLTRSQGVHRRLFIILLFIILLPLPPIGFVESGSSVSPWNEPLTSEGQGTLASAQGVGNGLDTISYFSRSITNQQSEILNSYENPNSHSSSLSLTQYLIAGWTLYSVSISIDSITAAPERESLISDADDYIRIENATGDVTDALYQGFYNQPHKGKLQNYTIIYRSPYYDFTNGDAYLGVRGDYD